MEIYILDKELNILGVFNTYEAIIWNTKYSEPGTMKASFIFSSEMNKILQRGNLIYKTDEIEPAIITRKFLTVNQKGDETIQIQGYMASRYLHQRIIWGKMIIKGTPEAVMRQMVYEQVIEPENTERKISRIQLDDLKGYEGEISKQTSYKNLQEELTDISNAAELGYRLRLLLDQKIFLFEVYKGKNRQIGSDTPCIFSREYGNVYAQEYSEDDSNFCNVCLIGGKGQDEERITTSVGNGSGIERYEMFYNASSISDADITAEEYIEQLQNAGIEKLIKYHPAMAFRSEININNAMESELGDYVTCIDKKWNVSVNTQIKEISKGYTKDEFSYAVTFGDDVPTLISLIKAKEG